MEKDGDAAVAIVCRHQSWLFSFFRGDAKGGEGEGARFRPIVSRRILECPIATAEKNGEIARLNIDDGDVGATVAIEVASETEIRSCVGTGIVPWLKGPITVAEEGRKAIPFAIDHEQVTGPIIIEVGETHTKRSLPPR